jgi:hypothetical protein|tara:strand:- start:86 stop:289 length:204 start_codon:yes stop_codon:yes gene_type:complete
MMKKITLPNSKVNAAKKTILEILNHEYYTPRDGERTYCQSDEHEAEDDKEYELANNLDRYEELQFDD